MIWLMPCLFTISSRSERSPKTGQAAHSVRVTAAFTRFDKSYNLEPTGLSSQKLVGKQAAFLIRADDQRPAAKPALGAERIDDPAKGKAPQGSQ